MRTFIKLLHFLLLLTSAFIVNAQYTEDFETGNTAGTKNFSSNSKNFTVIGDLEVSNYPNTE